MLTNRKSAKPPGGSKLSPGNLIGPRFAVTLFILITLAALGYEAYESYQTELRRAAAQADNLSLLLEERFRADVRAIEALLGNVADAFESETISPSTLAGGPSDPQSKAYLPRQFMLTGLADNLTLATLQGKVTYARIGAMGHPIADQGFLSALREDTAPGSIFSGLHVSPSTRLHVVSVGRQLRQRDGMLAGFVAADLDLFYFQRLLQSLNVAEHGSLTLLHQNGQIIARTPELPGDIGQHFVLPDAVGPSFLTSNRSITFIGASNYDAVHRMYSVRTLPAAPLTVVVGLSDRDFLATWRAKLAIHSGFFMALLALTIALQRAHAQERERAHALRESERHLQRSQQQLRTIIDAAPTALTISSAKDGRIVLANRLAATILGQPIQVMVNSRLHDFLVDPREATGLMRTLRTESVLLNREVRIQLHDGEYRWLQINAGLIEFDGRECVITGGNDITGRKKLELKLTEQATLDSLTGLANRRYFMELAKIEFQRARRGTHELSALMIDIDSFKNINDQHGHGAGDQVIIAVAQQLRDTLRASDRVGRMGGDEFAVMLPETSLPQACMAAENLRSAVAKLEVTFDEPFHVYISVGVAALQPGDSGFDCALKRADMALYAAKQRGRNRVEGEMT